MHRHRQTPRALLWPSPSRPPAPSLFNSGGIVGREVRQWPTAVAREQGGGGDSPLCVFRSASFVACQLPNRLERVASYLPSVDSSLEYRHQVHRHERLGDHSPHAGVEAILVKGQADARGHRYHGYRLHALLFAKPVNFLGCRKSVHLWSKLCDWLKGRATGWIAPSRGAINGQSINR